MNRIYYISIWSPASKRSWHTLPWVHDDYHQAFQMAVDVQLALTHCGVTCYYVAVTTISNGDFVEVDEPHA